MLAVLILSLNLFRKQQTEDCSEQQWWGYDAQQKMRSCCFIVGRSHAVQAQLWSRLCYFACLWLVKTNSWNSFVLFWQPWTTLVLMLICTQTLFISWLPFTTEKHIQPKIVSELIWSACHLLHHSEQQFVATSCRNAAKVGSNPTFIGFYRLEGSKSNAFEIIHSRLECSSPLKNSSARTVSLSAWEAVTGY